MSILDTIYNEMYVYYKYCCFIYSNKKEGKQYILIFFNNISEDYFLPVSIRPYMKKKDNRSYLTS